MVITSTLTERLRRRAEIEASNNFRRNAAYLRFEDLFIRPALRFALQSTGLYWRGKRNALNPVVRNFSIASPRLPREFDGFRLLHLSDLHIDCLPELAIVVSQSLTSLPCDLCVITGDYRFENKGPVDAALRGMREVLSGIRSEHGILGILGNHDPTAIAPALEDMGVRMLVNEAAEIRRSGASIWFAGVDDPYDFRTDDLNAAAGPILDGSFSVLLAHTPDLYARAADMGFDVYLCGHTHAGQIRFPLIGSVMQNSDAPKRFTYRRWHYGPMQGYTSAGIGSSMLPIRFNCPPELVLFTLERA